MRKSYDVCVVLGCGITRDERDDVDDDDADDATSSSGTLHGRETGLGVPHRYQLVGVRGGSSNATLGLMRCDREGDARVHFFGAIFGLDLKCVGHRNLGLVK